MGIDEDDIIEQYGGETPSGRWILPSGARVSYGGEDHRKMAAQFMIEMKTPQSISK